MSDAPAHVRLCAAEDPPPVSEEQPCGDAPREKGAW
eukprot:gene11295-20484_t